MSRTLYRRSPGPAPHTLVPHTEALPSPLPPTSLLIRVHAISLNYRDANMLHGTNPFPILDEGIPCSDAAGTVVALGSHTSGRFEVGDRVAPILDQRAVTGEEQEREWLGGEVDGVLADYVVFAEEKCVLLPKALGWAEAACLPNAGVTAWSALAKEGTLVAGRTVLVQGTGGVSLMAVKLAWAAGCRVFLTSSGDVKLARVREMARRMGKEGCLETINYSSTPAWEEEVLRLNGGKGVDTVLENGGASSLMQSLRAVKKGGVISQVGYLGTQDPKHLEGVVPALIDKTVNWRGINVGSRLDFERMNAVIEATGTRFEDIIDARFAFGEAGQALDYLWEGKHVGKVVLEMEH